MNFKEIFKQALSYKDYRELIDKLLTENKTTGNDQSQKKIDFTKLNVQRMNRLDKTINISAAIQQKLKNVDKPLNWLLVGDAWCGDCAQIIPVINKIAEASGGNIHLKIISRDSNAELTETYQAKSIPKLLFVDIENNKVTAAWGPRPKPAQEIMLRWKESNGKITWDDFEKELHLWYTKDKGLTITNEIIALMIKEGIILSGALI